MRLSYTTIIDYYFIMDKIILLAVFSAILFGVVKFVETKYFGEEKKGLKFVIRDSIIVFGTTAIVSFAFSYLNSHMNDFFNIVTETNHFIPTDAPVFTGTPDF